MRFLKSLPLFALALPSVALAAAPRTFSELANLLVTILDSATGLLVVAGIVIFVMVSIWGILRLLQSTLFGSTQSATSGSQTIQSTSFQAPAFSE